MSIRAIGFFFLGSLAVACGGGTDGAADPLTSEADIVTAPAAPQEIIRGALTKGELVPVAIVEKQGPEDTNVVDVDFAKTKLAGAETQLLTKMKGNEFWIRGTSTLRDTGKVVHGSKISGASCSAGSPIFSAPRSRKRAKGTARRG